MVCSFAWRCPERFRCARARAVRRLGKSTVLERLCMLPLFPRDRGLCTSVPIKINIRRAPTPRPTTLEVSEDPQPNPTQPNPSSAREPSVAAWTRLGHSKVRALTCSVVFAAPQVWNTTTNEQEGRTRVIPLETGGVDVRAAMAEAIASENVEVCPASLALARNGVLPTGLRRGVLLAGTAPHNNARSVQPHALLTRNHPLSCVAS